MTETHLAVFTRACYNKKMENSKIQHKSRREHVHRPIRVGDLLAILVLGAIALSLAVVGIRYIHFLFLDIRQVDYTTTVVEQDCQMILIRSEYPIYAEHDGEFVPTLEEGQRVKEGDLVGYIQWDEETRYSVQAEHTGLISYQIDGWETALTVDKMDQVDWLHAFSTIDVNKEMNKNSVESLDLSSGRVIAKVVDNLIAPVLVIRGIDLTLDPETETSFQFFLSEDVKKKMPLEATTLECGSLADGSQYIFAQPDQIDDRYYTIRYDEISLVNKIITGMTIPATAILWDEESKVPFVYCCKRGKLVRSEVTIVYKSDEIAVVEGVTVGDEVIANPERAKEGQRIFK